MQEDAQINVCCFHLALVGVQACVKTKALCIFTSAFTRYSYFPSTPFLHSDPANESPCPKGTLLKSTFQVFIHTRQFAGSADKVTQGNRTAWGMPRIGTGLLSLSPGRQEAQGIVIAAPCWSRCGTQHMPTASLLMWADLWSKVAWIFSYLEEVGEVIATLSQSVP